MAVSLRAAAGPSAHRTTSTRVRIRESWLERGSRCSARVTTRSTDDALLGPPVVSSRHVRGARAERRMRRYRFGAVRGELAGRLRHVASRRRQRARDERPSKPSRASASATSLQPSPGAVEEERRPAGHHARDVIRRHDIPGADHEPLMMFASSRTLPGQGYEARSCTRARVDRTDRPSRIACGRPGAAPMVECRRTFAQRRDVDRQDVRRTADPPANCLSGGFGQILVRRRDHPHIHGDRLLAAEPLDNA